MHQYCRMASGLGDLSVRFSWRCKEILKGTKKFINLDADRILGRSFLSVRAWDNTQLPHSGPSFHILGPPFQKASTFWVLHILGIGSPYSGSTLSGTVRESGRPRSPLGPLGSLNSHHGRTLQLFLQDGPAFFPASNSPLQKDHGNTG